MESVTLEIGLHGVGRAEVTLDPPRATVSYDTAKVAPRDLAKAVEEEGYTASPAA